MYTTQYIYILLKLTAGTSMLASSNPNSLSFTLKNAIFPETDLSSDSTLYHHIVTLCIVNLWSKKFWVKFNWFDSELITDFKIILQTLLGIKIKITYAMIRYHSIPKCIFGCKRYNTTNRNDFSKSSIVMTHDTSLSHW